MMHVVLRASTLCALAFATPVPAHPVDVRFIDLPGCDAITEPVQHELGNHRPAAAHGGHAGPFGPFPIEQAIDSSSTLATVDQCSVAITPAANDYRVSIRNVSGKSWANLYFVADLNIHFNNRDGDIAGGDAMFLDDFGVNRPLVGGDDGDLVFEPGENWLFEVRDWSGAAAPHFFTSLGVGAASVDDPIGSFSASNASIVAFAIVPEPATLLLTGLALLGLPGARARKPR